MIKPVKITIRGNYYDCQIYRGRLYLWTFDGALKVYDWDKLVMSLVKEERDKVVMTYAFLNGDVLYQENIRKLFEDIEFKKLLSKKFNRLEHLELTEKQADEFIIGQQDVPTNILPIDTEIYDNCLYFIHENGLFSSKIHRGKSNKYPAGSKPDKLWDCSLLSVTANKYPQLALSAGNDGLFEYKPDDFRENGTRKVDNSIYQVSEKHSSFSNYSFSSIYSSSFAESSFLSLFKWVEDKDSRKNRLFDKDISEQDIFDNSENERCVTSWGVDDKIYMVVDNHIRTVKFKSYEKAEKDKFTKLNSSEVSLRNNVISGGTTYFGNIIEYEDSLSVIQSNNEFFDIPESVTRWRTYPRSINYRNHLHVILDDRLEIYSFNHDYFISQPDKTMGLQYIFQRNSKKNYKNNEHEYIPTSNSISEGSYDVSDLIQDGDIFS